MMQSTDRSVSAVVDNRRPLGFYFLMVFLAVGVSFIGWNFGTVKGACIGFFFTCVINIYALTIKND